MKEQCFGDTGLGNMNGSSPHEGKTPSREVAGFSEQQQQQVICTRHGRIQEITLEK